MARVGPKGQIVIDKAIRDRLGVVPGALAVQRVVGDHVEIRFVPPVHTRSLRGILAPHTALHVPPEEWHAARERAAGISTRDAWQRDEPGDTA